MCIRDSPYVATWLLGPDGQTSARLAAEDIVLFNDMIGGAYRRFGARVADVGKAFASADITPIVDSPIFGQVPIAVARICQWTWVCAPAPIGPDVHGNTEGYGVMADVFYRAINASR